MALTAANIPSLRQKDLDRFWSKVNLTADKSKCWIWNACKDKKGYGQFFVRDKHYQVHRVAYFIHNGVLRNDLVVMHTCDTPSCCNPNHLQNRSQTDNLLDMYAKQRRILPTKEKNGHLTHPEKTSKGSHRPCAKLTEATVVEILTILQDQSIPFSSAAKQFGVSKQSIKYIYNRKTWRHVNISFVLPKRKVGNKFKNI